MKQSEVVIRHEELQLVPLSLITSSLNIKKEIQAREEAVNNP